jgi:hypothetical protein
MERLSFSFYRALAEELDTYETHFSQLQRDYARELRGETLLFAVDFSELHDYMHFAGRDAHRAAINSYILNTLEDRFSMLPGAVGELLADIEKVVPRHLLPDFGKALYTHPAVAEFLSGFPEGIWQEERLIELYVNAEAELRSALGGILNVLLLGDHYGSIQALQDLVNEGKLTPIEGVQQIGPVSSEAKAKLRLVESYLNLSRPTRSESNQIDAIDFTIALLLNQRGGQPGKRYITIYSQAASLIQACRAHDNLRWDNDYLIREAKYFQFRARLQGMFPTTAQRQEYVEEGHRLCQQLKAEISKLVDVDEQIQERAIEAPLKLLDLYRRFEEEWVQPLSFRVGAEDISVTRKRAQKLYEILKDQERFEGKTQDAYEVLKEHLRNIQGTLQAFTPARTDASDARVYKANLRRWLGLGDIETSEEGDAESAQEARR